MNCYNTNEFTANDWLNTDEEWNMLEKIDDNILSGGCDDMRAFLESLTEEEVAAMVKWLRRKTDKYYPVGDYMNIVAKSIVVDDYITANAMEAVENNLDTVAKMVKLWQFAIDNS